MMLWTTLPGRLDDAEAGRTAEPFVRRGAGGARAGTSVGVVHTTRLDDPDSGIATLTAQGFCHTVIASVTSRAVMAEVVMVAIRPLCRRKQVRPSSRSAGSIGSKAPMRA